MGNVTSRIVHVLDGMFVASFFLKSLYGEAEKATASSLFTLIAFSLLESG